LIFFLCFFLEGRSDGNSPQAQSSELNANKKTAARHTPTTAVFFIFRATTMSVVLVDNAQGILNAELANLQACSFLSFR
jgi:hypothetical protein